MSTYVSVFYCLTGERIIGAHSRSSSGCGYVCHFKCMHNVSAACAGKNSMDSSRNLVEQTTKCKRVWRFTPINKKLMAALNSSNFW